MKRWGGLVLVILILLYSCAPSRFVRPLQKDQQSLSVSFGGPTILYSGAPVPVPFTTLCYAKGFRDKLTGFGALHFTSSLFGNLQADAGAVIGLFEKKSGLGMSCTPALQAAYSVGQVKTLKFWPSLDANVFYHKPGKLSYTYAGFNVWFEPSAYKAHGEPQNHHLIPNLQMGYVLVSGKWQHQFEFKYLGIGLPNLPGVVDYIGIGGKGSLGLYYHLIRTF